MNREITKKTLQVFPIVAAAVGIYFYYGGTADPGTFQILILGLLIGVNIIYCSALLNNKFPTLAKQIIAGLVVVSVVLIYTDRSLDIRPRMLQILIAFVTLNFIFYLAARRKNIFPQQQ